MLVIPNTIVSDNGLQFIADNFKRFADKWDITHVTSSPKFPQSNGEAERAVQTVKGLMNKNVHFHAAFCAYRDTPLANGYSPSQLLFNRPMNSMGILTDDQVESLREFRDLNKRPNKLQDLVPEIKVQSYLGKEWSLESLGRHQPRPL